MGTWGYNPQKWSYTYNTKKITIHLVGVFFPGQVSPKNGSENKEGPNFELDFLPWIGLTNASSRWFNSCPPII